jgi:hypothetical protein
MPRTRFHNNLFVLIGAAVLAMAVPGGLAGDAVQAGVSTGSGDSSSSSGTSNRTRPHPPGFTEGYGNNKVLSFRYDQQFYCTDDRGDDLDGPGHNGDGLRSEVDPDEFQHPSMGPPGSPCIVGETPSGSLPKIDPTGKPAGQAEKVWAILPFFDSARDADATLEIVEAPFPTPPAVDLQCPEPGPPYTEHRGVFGTCTMHPSNLHVEPALASLPFPNTTPAGDIPLPNHSHIIDGDSFNPIWWQTIAVRVFDERIWPDFDGRCLANPAGGPPCLTSLDALRRAQARGQAGPDVGSNVWLFFDSRQVDHH